MQIFLSGLIHELISGLPAGLMSAWEFRGVIVEEALKLVFMPLHEFGVASCFVVFGWMVILWKNKGFLLSDTSHIFHIAEWLIGVFRMAW